MQRLISLLSLLITFTAVHAQQFGTDWMTSPSPNDSSCLWFRRTFVAGGAKERPVHASVSIATASRFILYVNGRNVSAALYSNATSPSTTTPSATTFDVTRFLRPDSNTVAVLVCPNTTPPSSPKISLCFFGSTVTNRPFARSSAEGWLCHAASTAITTDGEIMDGRADAMPPAHGDMVTALWQPVAIVATPPHPIATAHPLPISAESLFGHSPRGYNPLTDNAAYAHATLCPRYFDVDRHSVTYDFSPGFFGFVRITLRGCRRGERIRIGNLTYICSGDIDEQAFCRFTPQHSRQVTISGDRWFRTEQVQEVEAIGI